MIPRPSISVLLRPLWDGAALACLIFAVSVCFYETATWAQEVPSGTAQTRQEPAKTPETSTPEIKIRAWNHDSFGRIVFEWTSKVVYAAKVEGGKLFVRFSKPLRGDLTPVLKQIPKYVTAAELEDDGRTVVFTLTRALSYRSFLHDYAVVVDLSDVAVAEPPPTVAKKATPVTPKTDASAKTAEAKAGETKTARKIKIPAMPSKKPKPPVFAVAKKLGVRIGRHPGFTRFVFDWTAPVDFKVKRRGTKATVSFNKPARINVRKVRKNLPPVVSAFNAATSATGLSVGMTLASGSRLRHFRAGTKVVVDILKPSSGTAPAKARKRTKSLRPTPLTAAKAKQPPVAAPVSSVTKAGVPQETAAAATTGATGDSWKQEGEGAPRTLEGIMQDDFFSLRFNWPEGVAAAIYRRAGYLWFIFDHLEALRLEGIVESSERRLEELVQVPDARATILRARARSGINPSLRKEGNVWFVDLKPQALRAEVPVMIKAEPEAETGARLFLPVVNAAGKMIIRDTVVGDKLFVVPVPGLGQGVNRSRSYAQFLLIGTAQGVVVEPYTDGLEVRVEADGVEVKSQNDMFISSRPADLDEASLFADSFNMEDSGEFEPMLAMDDWGRGPSPWFYESRKILLNEIAAAPANERNQLRLRLAQYYFANDMSGDAASLLKVIGEEDPQMAEEADYKLFLGISLFMNGNYAEAGKFLYSQGMNGLPEGVLWQASLAAEQGDWTSAADGFSRSAGLIQIYPANIRRKLDMLAAETAIAGEDYEAAKGFLDLVKESDPSSSELNYASYLLGKVFMATGSPDSALAIWDKVNEGSDRRSRAKASYAKINYLYDSGSLTRPELIDGLEKLSFTWRGGQFEFSLLEELGDLYLEEGDFQNSLITLKQAATAFPRYEKARDLTRKMGEIFVSLYLDGGADNLSPVKALAIFNEFRELTPAGERGDRMIRNLADRMVAVDLLGEAGELLDQQIKFRLQGKEKAEVGAQLSSIQILDRTPQKALETLAETVEKGLSSGLVARRRHLEARALVDSKRRPEALALLKGDESLDANKLRADIFWREQNWAAAAAAISRVVEKIEHPSATDAESASLKSDSKAKKGAAETTKIAGKQESSEEKTVKATEGPGVETEAEAVTGEAPVMRAGAEEVSPHLLMRWAVALALSDNTAGLFYLRDKYAAFMRRSPYLDDFTVIVSEPTGSADSMKAITERLKEVGKYEAFMTGYRERLKDEDLSVVN